MKAIILAAGEGTRLRPYTLECPKCMIEIDGKSLIDRQLSVLGNREISEVIIIGGYKIEMLEGKGNKIIENPRYYETNMVSTLFSAEEELNGTLIISYGDIVYSKEVLELLLDSEADVSVVIDKDWESYWRGRNDNPLDDAETLKIAKNGDILEIGQKPDNLEEIEGQYIGLMKFTSKGISQIKSTFLSIKENKSLLSKSVDEAYMTDLLQAAIDLGIPVTPVFINGGWVEVDTVKDMTSEVTLKRLKSI